MTYSEASNVATENHEPGKVEIRGMGSNPSFDIRICVLHRHRERCADRGALHGTGLVRV